MPAGIGYGNKGRGRGRVERLPGGKLPRAGRLPAGLPKAAQPGFEPGSPARGRQRGVGAQGKGQGAVNGVGLGAAKPAAMSGPGGRQLAARVASGAITQEQAQRTMQQRQTLAKALGPDWRERLQVGGQSFAQVNKGLKANPQDPKLAAIRKKLLANRSSVLELARAKTKGKGKKAPAGEGEA